MRFLDFQQCIIEKHVRPVETASIQHHFGVEETFVLQKQVVNSADFLAYGMHDDKDIATLTNPLH